MSILKSSLLLISILFILFSCNSNSKNIERFSEEKPYAIQITKERSFYQAEKLANRLVEMGLDAYIVQNNDSLKDVGEWYYILCGI